MIAPGSLCGFRECKIQRPNQVSMRVSGALLTFQRYRWVLVYFRGFPVGLRFKGLKSIRESHEFPL